MGGKLDSTNILNNQCISVISKIAKDHEAFLGTTLEEIAKHKAGILRPNVTYIVNPSNEQHVQDVIEEYAKEIGAGPRLLPDTPELRQGLYSTTDWKLFAGPLRPFQRDNAALAIVAVKEAMKGLGTITDDMIASELTKVRVEKIPGRLEYTTVIPVFGAAGNVGREIIVDGAHNVDAAHAMHSFVSEQGRYKKIWGLRQPQSGWPVTWVLAMTHGKDASNYLKVILRPGDKVITTSFGPVDGMPWVKPMDPVELLKIAEQVQPDITGLAMPQPGALRALCAAKHLTDRARPIILTGSLYLVGDFHRCIRGINHCSFWAQNEFEDERNAMTTMQEEEKERVTRLLNLQDPNVLSSDFGRAR
jgi:folylpolyglutamate synthase/dihydropteroate synthase